MRKIFLSLIVPVIAAIAAPGPTQFRQDLQYFARELPKRHKNAFHFTTREQFRAAISALDSKLDSLDEDAFYVGLVRIAAMIGDAHTRVRLAETAQRLYPLNIVRFGD